MLFPEIKNLNNISDNFFERFNITNNGLKNNDIIDILQVKADTISPDINTFIKELDKDNVIIKFGIDPTGEEIHLGHTLPINIARILQSTGKNINLLIGDFTAKIGDPTGRKTERKVISKEEIIHNSEKYAMQAGKILNLDKTNIIYNSNLLGDVSIEELIRVFQDISLNNLIQREDFRSRLSNGNGISLAEIVYPLLMAIDSIKMKANIEIGGRDQLLNFHITRELMKKNNLDAESFITTPILPGINGNGEKMSKSLGNYIGLLEDSENIFGKIMSIPDSLITLYIINFIDIQTSEIENFKKLINEYPYIFKKALALYITQLITSKKEAISAYDTFNRKISNKEILDEDFITINIISSNKLIDILVDNGAISSKNEARRLMKGGAFKEIINNKISNKIEEDIIITGELFLRIGKNKFYKISV